MVKIKALKIVVPDDAVVEAEIRIVSYLDAKGNAVTRFRVSPDRDYGTLIGLMDRVKHDLMHDAGLAT